MADEATTTTTDTAGITRSPDGQITDGQTTQTDQGSSTTTTTQDSTGKTLLTEGEKKPVEAKPTDKAADKTSKEGAPEAYADYTLPDGYTLDPKIKTEADAIFKGLGLSQEAAQSLVDFYTSKTSDAFAAPYKEYKALTDTWRASSESHPDLRGKLGPGQEVNVRIAKALDGLGDPKLASDFREAMDLTGVGNHPAFIRVIDKWAQKVTEGTHVAGKGPSEMGQSQSGSVAKPSTAGAIWPGLPSANSGR